MRAAVRVTGRGIACVAYEGDNGYAALVAEVEVDQASGRVQPKRFVVALDCGPISNPDGLRNQIEGGVLQGMSRALGRRNHLGRSQGDFDRLAELPHAAAWNSGASHRERSYRPARSESDRRGRDSDYTGCRGDRQRDFRRYRRTNPASAIHGRSRERGARRAGMRDTSRSCNDSSAGAMRVASA